MSSRSRATAGGEDLATTAKDAAHVPQKRLLQDLEALKQGIADPSSVNAPDGHLGPARSAFGIARDGLVPGSTVNLGYTMTARAAEHRAEVQAQPVIAFPATAAGHRGTGV